MSLLNEALRAIEARDAGDVAPASVPPGLRDASRSPRSVRVVRWGVLVVLVSVAGAAWWLEARQTNPLNASEGEHLVVTVTESLDAPAQPLPDEVAVVQAPAPSQDTSTVPDVADPPVTAEVAEVAEVVEVEAVAKAEDVVTAPPVPVLSAPVQTEPESPPMKLSRPPVSVAAALPVTTAPPRTPSPVDLPPAMQDRQLAREARRDLAEGRIPQALARLEAHLARDPQARETRLVLAGWYLMQADYALLAALLTPEALSASPGLRQIAARHALATAEPEQAWTLLASQPPDVRTDPDYHALLAGIAQQTGRSDEAVRLWSALLEVDNARADWWAGLGIALDSRARPEQALAAYRQALALPGLALPLRQYALQRTQALNTDSEG